MKFKVKVTGDLISIRDTPPCPSYTWCKIILWLWAVLGRFVSTGREIQALFWMIYLSFFTKKNIYNKNCNCDHSHFNIDLTGRLNQFWKSYCPLRIYPKEIYMYGGNSYILNQYFYVSVRYMRLYSICLPKGDFVWENMATQA